MNEPKNWKWIVPAATATGLFVAGFVFQYLAAEWPVSFQFACGSALLALMIIAAIAAVANFHNYFAWEETQRFIATQHALNTTPVTLIADALKNMHPKAAEVLNRFGVRTTWQVKVEPSQSPEWILLGTNVRFDFIEYVLNNSGPVALMSKRSLSQGAYHFDPSGLTSDYDQYDELQNWMIGRLMVTRPFGNLASQWIPPWNPTTVREMMGLVEGQVHELAPPQEVVEKLKKELRDGDK